MEKKSPVTLTANSSCLGLFKLGRACFAIFGPVIFIIAGYVIPFGDAQSRSYLLKLIDTTVGKSLLFFIVSLTIFCAFAQILTVLNHLKIYPKRAKLMTYGLAFIWIIHLFYLLFIR